VQQEVRDEYDIKFQANPNTFRSVKCYGYHSTGYCLFFKPDLGEVIKIAQNHLREAKICFVTTDTCSSEGIRTDNVPNCFDSDLYMHIAVTTLWIVDKDIEVNKDTKLEKVDVDKDVEVKRHQA